MNVDEDTDQRHAAYLAWRKSGLPITMAARIHGVEPNDIMQTFMEEEPVTYWVFAAKLVVALTVASWLVLIHSLLKGLRELIERSLR